MKELIAKEGMYLTQKGDAGESRTYITAIIGATVNPDDWREATEEEKEAFEKMQEDKLKSEQDGTDIQ